MADPRGLFVNRQNAGLGTVLGPKGKDFYDYQLADQERKRREAARQKAAADKKKADMDKEAMKLLQGKDTYRIYQDAADNYLNEAIDKYAAGQLDAAGIMRYAAKYNNLVNKGNQLQKIDETAIEEARKNKRINEDMYVQLRNQRYLTDQSIDGLESRVVNPDEGMFFYQDQTGGSAVLNEQEVVKDVVGKLGTQARASIQDGKTTWLRGNKIMSATEIEEKYNNAFEYDAASNSYRVKDPKALMDLNIIPSLMSDADFRRVVLDKIYVGDGMTEDEFEKLPASRRNEIISEKVAETLSPYAGGEMGIKDATKQYRYSPKPENGGADADERRTEWYQHLKSGDQTLTSNALDFLTQDNAQLTGATLQRIRKSAMVGPDAGPYSYRGDERDDGTIDPYKEYRVISIEPNTDGGVAVARVVPLDDKGKPATRIDADDNEVPIRPENITIDLKYGETDPEFWLSLYNEAYRYGKQHYNKNKGGRLGGQSQQVKKQGDDPYGFKSKKTPWQY